MSIQDTPRGDDGSTKFGLGEVSGTIQLLVADAGSRQVIQAMLEDHFEVVTDETVVSSDLYLVEDRLLQTYQDDIINQVRKSSPAFCPVMVIQGTEQKVSAIIEIGSSTDTPLFIDDVVGAPVDRSYLIRRIHSLLIRRKQSLELLERTNSLAERDQQLRRYERAVESSGNGILLIDTEGTIETANPAFAEITGYPPDEITGQSPEILHPKEAGTVFSADFWRNLADLQEWDGELLIERKGGHRCVANVSITAITDEEINEGFVMVLTDITHRIQHEQELANSEADLELLRQILTRYIRHNLRNELTVIHGYAQMLVDAGDPTVEANAWAKKVLEATNRLIATSDNARYYSSLIEHGDGLSAFDLSQIVTDAVNDFRETFPQVEFTVDIPASCYIHSREGIAHAVEELMQNAVVHNDAESPAVAIEIREMDGTQLIIEDNGPGIANDELAVLEARRETPLSHTQGIGLWLSKWVIETIGGDLGFETGDCGTRVTVQIPPADHIGTDGIDIPALMARENRLETVLNRVTDAVLQVDGDWGITFLDKRAEEILGVDAEAILGGDLWEQFPQTRKTNFEARKRESMDNRTTERVVEYYPPIDGWLEVVIYPEFDGGLSFYFRDVTERKSREERLAQAQERIEFALNGTDATIWEWNFVEDSITTHPEIHTGFDTAITTLDGFIAGIHPDDQAHVQQALRTAIDTGTPHQVEYRVQSEDGTRWMEEYGEIRYENGTPIEMIGIARDITKRKHRERRYEAIFNQTYQFTGLMEPDGTLVEANDAALNFGGVSRDDVIGSKVWNTPWFMIAPETQAQTEADVRRAATGEFVRRELEVRGHTDTAIIDFTIRPITDEEGKVRWLIPEGRDITELKEREQNLRERVKELDAIHRTRAIFDEQDQPIAELVNTFVELLPTAFQCPAQTAARLTLDGEEISTDTYASGYPSITSRATIRNETTLTLEVTSLTEGTSDASDVFLPEEQELLDTLATIVQGELAERSHWDVLARQHDLLKTAEALGGVGVWEFDRETEAMFWSEGTRRIHEVGTEFEPTFEQAIECYHPDEQAMIAEAVEKTIESGKPFSVEAQLRTANDNRRWIRTGGQMLDNGSTLRGYIMDITEDREHRKQMEANEEKLRIALEAGNLGMWELDLQSEESPVRTFRHDEIFGYASPVEDWSFERFLEHVHPDDRGMVEQSFEEAFEDGSWRFTCRIQRIDGEERWITAEGLFFYDECNEPSHAIGIVEDVTDETEAKADLREKTDRLEEFARTVSHDIKNPLTVAQGRLELYRERGEEDDLASVAQALSRIEEITTDLTALARFGTPDIDPVPVSLEETARDAWHMIDTLDADLHIEDLEIIADQSQLQGIFENLFKNAVGHGGPDVTVRVGSLPDGFYIEDTGKGIPPERREDVFESGFSTGYSGSGIGLTIVSRIVETHGWKINVTASTEGGARFEITGVRVDASPE